MKARYALAIVLIQVMLVTAPAMAGAAGVEPPGQVTIVAVGDTMFGNTPNLPANPATYVSEVNGTFADADIVFGNLEGTLSTSDTSKCRPGDPYCHAYKMPPAWAGYLRAQGFDVMGSANNHSRDYGIRSQDQTTKALARAGIAQTGLHGQIAVLTGNGVSVAFLAFSPYARTAWMLDRPAAKALIHQAGTLADVVVVYMHAGAEGADAQHVTGHTEYYLGENRGNPRAFAEMAVRNGADLVIASGPHVLRGMEMYHGRLIAYSLGDFAGYHNYSSAGVLSISMILEASMGADGTFLGAQIVPIRLDAANRPHPDPKGKAIPFVANLSTEDFGADAASITPDGMVGMPPSP